MLCIFYNSLNTLWRIFTVIVNIRFIEQNTRLYKSIFMSSQYSNFISDAPLISRNDSIKLGNLGNDTHLYKYWFYL